MCINFSFKRKQEPGQNKCGFKSEKRLNLFLFIFFLAC